MVTTARRPFGAHLASVPGADRDPAAAAIEAALARIAETEATLAGLRADLAIVAEARLRPAASSAPSALTTMDVVREFQLSRSTVAAMLAAGELRSHKVGGSRRVFPADLDAYIERIRSVASRARTRTAG